MVAGISKLARFPVELPQTPLPDNIKPKDVAVDFENILTRLHDPHSFTSDAIWRDTFAFTGTLRTFYSAQGITKAWIAATELSTALVEDSLTINHNLAMIMAAPNGGSWVEVSGSFRTRTTNGLTGKCSLMMAVVPEGREWRIWTLRTILEDIEEFPSVNQCSLPTLNGSIDVKQDGQYFDAVVVGGGQCGLGAAGRLQALGINYVLIDKYEQIGDSWKTRYDSVRLHTIREYSHLPFERTFPFDKYQEYLTKDELAQGFQAWAHKYGIDQHVWTKTELLSGNWDGKQWSLKIRKNGQQMVLRSRFVVMASGPGGQIPRSHDLPGRETFQGTVLHSQQYKSSQTWSGKKGVVIGIANTAHDVADDMCEAGLSTTMIQRSQTYVMPDKYWQRVSQRTYNKDFPTDLADKLLSTGPAAVGRLIVVSTLHQMAASEPERFEALQKAGFSVEPKGDIFYHLYDKPGGYYMDVGTSKKIADGRIKIKSGAPSHYTAEGLGFPDGSTVPADVIVWASGFETNMKHYVRELFGNETADQIDEFFGIDDEGELRGVWKIQHPGLITHGLSFGQARFQSKYVAIQIKAVLEKKPFIAYNETPVPVALKDGKI